jgi:hypothetical protein
MFWCDNLPTLSTRHDYVKFVKHDYVKLEKLIKTCTLIHSERAPNEYMQVHVAVIEFKMHCTNGTKVHTSEWSRVCCDEQIMYLEVQVVQGQ